MPGTWPSRTLEHRDRVRAVGSRRGPAHEGPCQVWSSISSRAAPSRRFFAPARGSGRGFCGAPSAPGTGGPLDEDAALPRICKTSNKSASLSSFAFFRSRPLRFSAFLNCLAMRFLSAFKSLCCFLRRSMLSRSSLGPVAAVGLALALGSAAEASAAGPAVGPLEGASAPQGEPPRPSPSLSSPAPSAARGLAMADRPRRSPGIPFAEPRSYGDGLARAREGLVPLRREKPGGPRRRWAQSRALRRPAQRP